ncbi:UNVERIFIED_CONTAM: hypothetical protein FKN15_022165 [Acipenser sinensis]
MAGSGVLFLQVSLFVFVAQLAGVAHCNSGRKEVSSVDGLYRIRIPRKSGQTGVEVAYVTSFVRAATRDLESFDSVRHEEFKRYEMLKEHERREYLRSLEQEKRESEEKREEERKQRHREHPKINVPLEKVYDPKNEDDDMTEMEEERLRMREHVMRNVDANHDRLVTLEEFLKSTERKDFANTDEWEILSQLKRRNQLKPHQYLMGTLPQQNRPKTNHNRPPESVNADPPPQIEFTRGVCGPECTVQENI